MQYTDKKDDLGLIFVYDALMLRDIQERFKIKAEFVSFAYIEGYKLFRYRKGIVAQHQDLAKGKKGNDKVFGSVYAVPNFAYSLITLDAYYYCSNARLGYCTEHDMRERVRVDVHLFDIDSVDTLISHRYKKHTTTRADCWLGNKRDAWLTKHINYGRYRIVQGIDVPNYKKLLEERGID